MENINTNTKNNVTKANEKGGKEMNKIQKAVEILNKQDDFMWIGNYVHKKNLIDFFTILLDVEVYKTHREDTVLVYAEDVPMLQELHPESQFPAAYLILYDHYIEGVPNLLVLQKGFHKLSKAEQQFCYWHELGHAETFSPYSLPMTLEYRADEYAIKKIKSKRGAVKLLSRLFLMFLRKGEVRPGLYQRIKKIKEVSIKNEKVLS